MATACVCASGVRDKETEAQMTNITSSHYFECPSINTRRTQQLIRTYLFE
jgi:hypothetical protein